VTGDVPENYISNPSGNAGGKAPLLFVVDDEPLLLELARLILEPLGYEIVTFQDPEEALIAIKKAERKPDLIITDYSMRKLSGARLLHECRKLNPSQKILVVSGTVSQEVFTHLPDKPDKFLSKPYKTYELETLVKELVPPPSSNPQK